MTNTLILLCAKDTMMKTGKFVLYTILVLNATLIITAINTNHVFYAEGIVVAEDGTNTTDLSTGDDAVLESLNNARNALEDGNNTAAIFAVIEAIELEHGLNERAGREQNQTTRVERNMGAMSNNITDLNLTDVINPFK